MLLFFVQLALYIFLTHYCSLYFCPVNASARVSHMLENYKSETLLSYLSTGEYHCPVMNKVFTEYTHIVAVKTTGNVFCYEVFFLNFLWWGLSSTCVYVLLHVVLLPCRQLKN